MTEVPDEDPVIILLISRKLAQTNEKAIFGYHLPWSEFENPPFLFQLGPVHYVFKGVNAGRPGWTVDGDGYLVFGERPSGVTFVLGRDIKRMKVSHHVSGDGVYSATAWRGYWEADVQRILRCGLRCDRTITTPVRRMYFFWGSFASQDKRGDEASKYTLEPSHLISFLYHASFAALMQPRPTI